MLNLILSISQLLISPAYAFQYAYVICESAGFIPLNQPVYVFRRTHATTSIFDKSSLSYTHTRSDICRRALMSKGMYVNSEGKSNMKAFAALKRVYVGSLGLIVHTYPCPIATVLRLRLVRSQSNCTAIHGGPFAHPNLR